MKNTKKTFDAFGRKPISKTEAERHVKKYATGAKFRNMQMWSTKYECEGPQGYYIIEIGDNGTCYMHNASDLF